MVYRMKYKSVTTCKPFCIIRLNGCHRGQKVRNYNVGIYHGSCGDAFCGDHLGA